MKHVLRSLPILIITGILLGAFGTFAPSGTLRAQETGTQLDSGLHPGTYDFNKAWYNNTFYGRHTFTKASTTGDTLVIPKYKNGDHIVLTRKTVPTNSAARENTFIITHCAAGAVNDTIIIKPDVAADTATIDFQIKRMQHR